MVWYQSADGETSDFEKTEKPRWKAKGPVVRSWQTYEANGWIQCKGHLPWENKFAVRWITSFCLSTRIESTWKNNESWGWRSQTLLKFERKHEALICRTLRNSFEILSSQARPHLYVGWNRIHSHLRGESCLGQEKELTFSKWNHLY